jgi:hypothetical protein
MNTTFKNATFKKMAAILGMIVCGMWLSVTANAECGMSGWPQTGKYHKQAWQAGNPAAVLVLTGDEQDGIVGMWHVTFTGDHINGSSVDGFPVDNSLVVWHRDHTEIMNSVRPPQDGNFCMGVWEKTGEFKYKLNHFAWFANDTTNSPSGIGNPVGPTRIIENITLRTDGNHYEGRFTLIATDTSGNTTVTITGSIKGTRITTATTIKDLL